MLKHTLKHTVRALALLLLGLGLSTWVQLPASAIVDRDCGDFPTQAAAQKFFNNAGAGDPHGLDADNNGIACESNPCPCIGRGNPGGQNPGTTNNQQKQGPRIYRETGNVVRVIDGDTLKVRLRAGVVSVRMLGINTPERGRCGAGEATDNLRRMAPVRSGCTWSPTPPKQPRTGTDASCATSSDRAATTISRSARPGTATPSATCSPASPSPATASTFAASTAYDVAHRALEQLLVNIVSPPIAH